MHVEISQVWEDHFERIRRAALMLCGDPWDADDLVQETFLTVAQMPNRFQGRSGLYTWLYGILLNLDRRRRRRQGLHHRKVKDLQESPGRRAETTPAADSPLVAAEWKKSLWSRVHRLPEGQRECLVLRFSQELRYDEIADVLECPLGTVKSRVYHGLLALQRMLAGHEEASIPEFPDEDVIHDTQN